MAFEDNDFVDGDRTFDVIFNEETLVQFPNGNRITFTIIDDDGSGKYIFGTVKPVSNNHVWPHKEQSLYNRGGLLKENRNTAVRTC